MCLWNHFGQKKMLDCSVRRNVGNFRLGCSFHISYKSAAPPYSRSQFGPQGRQRTRGRETQLNKHLPRMDKSKLSASLSSLRCLTMENKRERTARSSDFLHKTQSSSSSSWL